MIDDVLKNAPRVGGGFYADVYGLTFENKLCACKVYRVKGLACEEMRQLAALAESGVKCPRVLKADALSDGREVLITEFVEGTNASDAYVPISKIDEAGAQIVEQALIMHNASNKDGYGFVCGDERLPKWSTFYRGFCERILCDARKNVAKGRISTDVTKFCENAFANFGEIFKNEPEKPSLIHGDFNPSNIMIDPETGGLNAVIDPIGSMWGDREYELFQLKCNGGERYGLFEKYAESVRLSDYYPVKEAFYAAFAELNHFNRLLTPEYASGLNRNEAEKIFQRQNEICRGYAEELARRSMKI